MSVGEGVRDEGRRKVHSGEVKFGDWVEGVGGVPDVGKCPGSQLLYFLFLFLFFYLGVSRGL